MAHCSGCLIPQLANSFGIRLHIVARATSCCNDDQTSLHACTNVDTMMGGLDLTMAPTTRTNMSDSAHGGRRGEGHKTATFPDERTILVVEESRLI